MKNINLNNCTKEDLQKSVSYALDNARYNLYVVLEDSHTANPTIVFTSDRDEKCNAFGEINAGYYGKLDNDEVLSALIEFEGNEEYITEVEPFVDKLFSYIEREYNR